MLSLCFDEKKFDLIIDDIKTDILLYIDELFSIYGSDVLNASELFEYIDIDDCYSNPAYVNKLHSLIIDCLGAYLKDLEEVGHMKYKLLGIQHYDFTSNKGERVTGNKLHCVSCDTVTGVTGFKVESISINDDVLNSFLNGNNEQQFLNREIEIYFNRYGRPDKVCLNK